MAAESRIDVDALAIEIEIQNAQDYADSGDFDDALRCLELANRAIFRAECAIKIEARRAGASGGSHKP